MKNLTHTLAATVTAALLTTCLPAISQAQTGILHKHPVASGVAAGLVAHHMAKKGAQSRATVGKKPTFAERHPVMSGVAAGALTHHVLKK